MQYLVLCAELLLPTSLLELHLGTRNKAGSGLLTFDCGLYNSSLAAVQHAWTWYRKTFNPKEASSHLVIFCKELSHVTDHLLWTFHARKVAAKIAFWSTVSRPLPRRGNIQHAFEEL
jgi:hypothetical protein